MGMILRPLGAHPRPAPMTSVVSGGGGKPPAWSSGVGPEARPALLRSACASASVRWSSGSDVPASAPDPEPHPHPALSETQILTSTCLRSGLPSAAPTRQSLPCWPHSKSPRTQQIPVSGVRTADQVATPSSSHVTA